jgi:phage terminase large subunit-like protein
LSEDAYHYHDKIPRRIERFFAEFLCHTQAPFTGQPFTLLPWQKEIVHDIYGTYKADGTRRYNTVYIEIPKKQGKSQRVFASTSFFWAITVGR